MAETCNTFAMIFMTCGDLLGVKANDEEFMFPELEISDGQNPYDRVKEWFYSLPGVTDEHFATLKTGLVVMSSIIPREYTHTFSVELPAEVIRKVCKLTKSRDPKFFHPTDWRCYEEHQSIISNRESHELQSQS